MKTEDTIYYIVALVFLIAIGCGLLYLQEIPRVAVRSEAVKHGHAEWVVVGDDGATEFRWKECRVCKPEAKGGDE